MMMMKTRTGLGWQEAYKDKMKTINKKAQQFGSILLVIALITSVFAVGLYTGGSDNKITGAVSGMEKVSGFAILKKMDDIDIEIQIDDTYPGLPGALKDTQYKFDKGQGYKLEPNDKWYNFLYQTYEYKEINGIDNVDEFLDHVYKENKGYEVKYIQSLGNNNEWFLLDSNKEDAKNKLIENGNLNGYIVPTLNLENSKDVQGDIKKYEEEIDIYNSITTGESSKINNEGQIKDKRVELGADYLQYKKDITNDKNKKIYLKTSLEYEALNSPETFVSKFESFSGEDKETAKEILKESYNDKNLMGALQNGVRSESKNLLTEIILEKGKNNEAYNVLNEQDKNIVDQLINNQKSANEADLEYVFDSKTQDYVFINKKNEIVDMVWDKEKTKYVPSPTGEKFSKEGSGLSSDGQYTNEMVEFLENKGLDIEDGKIIDEYGIEYIGEIKKNPKAKSPEDVFLFDTTKTVSPKTKKFGKIIAKKSDYFVDVDGNNLPVYLDAGGKAYDIKGNLITKNVIKKVNIVDGIDAEEVYAIDKNKIEEQLLSATIKSKNFEGESEDIPVNPLEYKLLTDSITDAGKDATTDGSLTQGDTLSVYNNDGQLKSQITRGDYEKITGFKKESKFNEKGEPLLIETISDDENTILEEKYEMVETGTSKDGKPVLEKKLKSWVKREKTDNEIEKNGYKYFQTLTTTRTIKTDTSGKKTVDIITDTTIDDLTGEPLKLTVEKDGDTTTAEFNDAGEITLTSGTDDSVKSQLNTLKQQYTSRVWVNRIESALTDFSGFGALNLLFRDEEWYFNWREGVDRAFAELYLGEEYWTSAVCASHVDRDQEGVAYLDTRLGLGGVAAHIEATRSEEIAKPAAGSSPAGSEFLYKITFHVKNGDWDRDPKSMEELKFNVFLYGERSARLLAKNIVLERGDDFGFTGAEAIVQFSDFHYSEICLEFDEAPWFWTLDDDELCNAIIGPSGPSSIGSGSASAEDQQAAAEQEKTGGDVLDI